VEVSKPYSTMLSSFKCQMKEFYHISYTSFFRRVGEVTERKEIGRGSEDHSPSFDENFMDCELSVN